MPWLESKPDVKKIDDVRRTIKSLRSRLRHRLADKKDLEEVHTGALFYCWVQYPRTYVLYVVIASFEYLESQKNVRETRNVGVAFFLNIIIPGISIPSNYPELLKSDESLFSVYKELTQTALDF